MIIEYYKDRKFHTQVVICKTELFDKEYFWMKDIDGTVYLAKSVDDQPALA